MRPGVSKVGVLVKLKASARNCSFQRSRTGMFLKTDRSRLNRPSLWMSGSVRETLPKVNAGGAVKASVLNQRLSVGLSILSLAPGTTLGRLPFEPTIGVER